MPFVHYPADAALDEAGKWAALTSRHARQPLPPSATRAERLRGECVCTYAGPCCYAPKRAVGVVALYFRPEVDRSKSGSASPFDSGALTEPDPCLQPWAARVHNGEMTLDECVRFVERRSVRLHAWRRRFQRWLEHCYHDPTRYLETTDDPWAAGLPEHTQPEALRMHNGPSGRAGPNGLPCADRRAWTWEARFADALEYEHLQCAHVAADSLEDAIDAFPCQVRTLPPGVPAGAKALYLQSGPLLGELTA